MDTFLYYLRWASLSMAIVNLVWLLLKSSLLWDRYTNTGRQLIVVLLLFLMTTVYGTGEVIAQDGAVGYRGILSFLAQAVLLGVLVKARGSSSLGQFYKTNEAK